MPLISTPKEHPRTLWACLLWLHLPSCFLELPVHSWRVSELAIHRLCTLQLVAGLHHDRSLQLLICPRIPGYFRKNFVSEKDRKYKMIVLEKATVNVSFISISNLSKMKIQRAYSQKQQKKNMVYHEQDKNAQVKTHYKI